MFAYPSISLTKMFFSLIIHSTLGLIWFIVPVSMIVCNDVMAYMFGFFFGRTPLIKLSPKKTWEGFIGGGFATVAFGVIFSYFLCQYQFFVCPIEYNEAAGKMGMECEPSYLFRPQEYTIVNWFFFLHLSTVLTRFVHYFFLLAVLKENIYNISIFTAFPINEHFQFSNWTVRRILCVRI